MKSAGKILLAIVLGYAGFMLASFVGGFLAGVLGAVFHLSAEPVASLTWTLPKAIFLGMLISIYIWWKRRKSDADDSRR
jgi:hypothetical protein